MNCLGIETTAHTFGCSIVTSEKQVLSNVRKSFVTEEGGMHPSEVAQHHVNHCGEVIAEALRLSGKGMQDIDLVSFSQGPGIGHMLRVGAIAARSLCVLHKIPLIGVNHCIAHLEIGQMLFNADDPLLLYASGANTQVIAYDGGKYRIFGETLDIGVGNFLDSAARAMGLGFPGGPKIYELSLKSSRLLDLPYVVKGMDVSFGGLLTNIKQKLDTESKEDIAYSIQETAFAMLLEVTERALAHCDKKELILGGGVACNLRLQEMAKGLCKERRVKCYIPGNEYLVDNAAMIAWLGLLMFPSEGGTEISHSSILPYERTDDVKVGWR
ncbi:tRNA (adenosine(37)-N6)-threonylcarbamoyltransferase complex transferase subunit TsaD [Candidatus Woesearchaeota archaeon]|nr:tRNA (adenosine(37)-N6)-threonylcarbamoyltransferase complex transferase subunit TsaD [Candidatus Woesearchaeota archaeon]